jgi:hypothetical protein
VEEIAVLFKAAAKPDGNGTSGGETPKPPTERRETRAHEKGPMTV